MNKQIEKEPYYDCLSIGHKLDNFLDGYDSQDIQLFAYFSAFLFHYAGNPIEEWKYRFTVGPNGYPHSMQLQDAIERHETVGMFISHDDSLSLSSRGTDEFNKFSNGLSLFKERERFIEAACSTSILLPYKEAKFALLEDVNISKAKSLGGQDWLDFEYDKLKQITESLGAPIDDLTISAVTWVRLIQLSNNKEEENV